MGILAPVLAIVAAWILLWFRVGPTPTWFYVFAWYPTLWLLDRIAVRLDQRPMLTDWGLTRSLLLWSPVIWLVFEAANLRLQNWYYVYLPGFLWERWIGILVSFATVLPAIFLAERVLAGAGAFKRARSTPIRVRAWELRAAIALGIGTAAMALIWHRMFFPLIWGAAFLVADPIVYRRTPSLSLIADLERGDWGRIARLLTGGLAVGVLWEGYNFWAQGKWIYTVPWLEHTKVFEMPPFGLLGFPVFALEAWAMYAALAALGVAVPVAGPAAVHRKRTLIAGAAAAVFAVATLVGVERYTISSTVPTMRDLPEATTDEISLLRDAGIRSPIDLATTNAEHLAKNTPLEMDTIHRLIQTARLVTLRGIGTAHARTLAAVGVRDVCALARSRDDLLTPALRRVSNGPRTRPRPRPTHAEVRVWIRAAQRHCGATVRLVN